MHKSVLFYFMSIVSSTHLRFHSDTLSLGRTDLVTNHQICTSSLIKNYNKPFRSINILVILPLGSTYGFSDSLHQIRTPHTTFMLNPTGLTSVYFKSLRLSPFLLPSGNPIPFSTYWCQTIADIHEQHHDHVFSTQDSTNHLHFERFLSSATTLAPHSNSNSNSNPNARNNTIC